MSLRRFVDKPVRRSAIILTVFHRLSSVSYATVGRTAGMVHGCGSSRDALSKKVTAKIPVPRLRTFARSATGLVLQSGLRVVGLED